MHTAVIGALGLVLAEAQLLGQVGPFDPEDWPETIDASKKVHYVATDPGLDPPSDTWLAGELMILSGGDQGTEPIAIAAHDGLKVTGNYLNVKDSTFEEWADDDIIDILVQVYGDESLLGPGGSTRNFVFLTGTLPELSFPSGGSIPAECKNRQWNWILFRIVNGLRADGTHFVGSIPANAQGGFAAGGVNGGTIRFEGVPGLTVRLVAFGEQGAFGEPEVINVCAEANPCPPEPETNLVRVDVAAGTSDHLAVLDNGDQTVAFQDGVGPPGDLRRAVRPAGQFMNFGIADNFLGEPCNDPKAVKICLDFYDDPALAGAIFGPEAFATDDVGGIGSYPLEKRHVLEGTGAWVRRSWTLPGVNLRGVNTTPLTGGPRLAFEGGAAIFISKVEMALLRTGDHPLAGQDPLSGCFEDPKICTDAYGNYAELDLGMGIENGLAPGASGGDQEMIQAEAGPAGDLRQAIRPAFDDGSPGFTHQYLNFAIVGEPFGPSSQPNAQLAICVTYYDDPALIASTFRPEAFQLDRGGSLTIGFASAAIAVSLEGTDQWRDAYFEIPEIKFQGVNQGPQAAARFVLSGKIFFTRVRYAVIRPCGPNAGVNLLQDCKDESTRILPTNLTCLLNQANVELSWKNNALYESLKVLRDGAELAPLAVDATSYVDTNVPAGEHTYQIAAKSGADEGGPSCQVRLGGKIFHRGDSDNNGQLQLTDAVRILGYLFLGQVAPTCFDAADADGNNQLQLTDAVRILGYLFLGQAPPAAPGPPTSPCGEDNDPTHLGCETYDKC
jgi:hypothetical protein